MSTFHMISAAECKGLTTGTIVFLPPRNAIPDGTFTDAALHARAFNHPALIVACPARVDAESRVEIATITSFHNTMFKSHLAAKGIKVRRGAEAARRAGYLRIATASKPCSQQSLRLKGGRGMKRDSAYVNVRTTYAVAAGALARYGGRGADVHEYCLTAHAARKVAEAIADSKGHRGKGTPSGKSVTASRGEDVRVSNAV